MSAFNDIDKDCDNCGEVFRAGVWTAVHASEDPELKDLLLGGELNLVRCPQCAFVTFEDRFVLYQEPRLDIAAYVYPERQKNEALELEKLMLAGYADAQASLPEPQRLTYKPILLFGLPALMDLLHQEEEMDEQQDIAKLICQQHKLATTHLARSRARAKKVPGLLPFVGDKKGRDAVLAGLARLLDVNPALGLYQAAQTHIAADPAWEL